MAVCPVFRRILRFAVIGLVAVLPGGPLHASSSPAPAAGDGVIAYAQRSTGNIRTISPDGTNDQLLWTNPDPVPEHKSIPMDLAWRPDGLELAFTSWHEDACSIYESDIYAVRSDGTGYRRITNAPACAEFPKLPKGTVTVEVQDGTGTAWVYVAGAPVAKQATSPTMTFDNVADFGVGILQPAVGIATSTVPPKRTGAGPPYADVEEGKTVPGGTLIITSNSGGPGFGAGGISWRADATTLGFNMRMCTIKDVPAVPPNGFLGADLPVVANATPCRQVWNPTLAGVHQYLYFSSDTKGDAAEGIYLNTEDEPSGGTKLVAWDYWFYYVVDMEWLPDGSGFIYSKGYFSFDTGCGGGMGSCNNIFAYDFETQQNTQLTNFADKATKYLSVSPDGQQIVFDRTTNPDLDLTSSLWIMNRDGTGLHKLLDDAGRASWGPTATLPPVAPADVSVKKEGTSAVLSWTDNLANTGGYLGWWSEKPYFVPGDGLSTSEVVPGRTSWTPDRVLGDPAYNYFFGVQGLGAGDATSELSKRVGAFSFGLTPGTQ